MIHARQNVPSNPPARRTSDIIGLCLFFFGAASLLWLTLPQNGVLPGALEMVLRMIAGTGAFGIPLIFMFVGSMFLVGFERLQFSHSTYGTLILFTTYCIWRHVVTPIDAGLIAKAPPGFDAAFFDSHVMVAGGYIGALLGTLFIKLLGNAATYLLLILLTSVSAVLLFDRPFIELLKQLKKPADAGFSVAKKGAIAAKDKAGQIRENRANRAVAETNSDDEPPTVKRQNRFLAVRKNSIPNDDEIETPIPGEFAARPVTPKRAGARFEQIQPATKMDQLALNVDIASADGFKLPGIKLLRESPPPNKRSKQENDEKIRVLELTLDQFGIGSNVVEIANGPSITRYEIRLAPGIKVNKIVSLADNLAMALAAQDVRVEAPIPGKSAIGVEVPNAIPSIVSLRECLDTTEFWNAPSKLTIALGKDVAGINRYTDLARMPHLLVAGSTNSGKSVCLNVIIASLLYRATPRDVQFLMIDPKRVELSLWDGIPHLMHPVVKDVKQAAGIFRAALKEMDRRYDLFSQLGTRNMEGYNQKVSEEERLPFIVLIVDELADLMMQQGAEVEQSICRLAQLARATGIHLVVATQRPSVDVITGLIKANISSRISFAVSSQIDSRTILDMAGAERLIGRGDMLFLPIDASKPMRIQGCYLSETETNDLVNFLKEQEKPKFTITPLEVPSYSGGSGRGASREDDGDDDELFESAVRLVVTNGQASTSMLQRRFKVGYTRAARLVDLMEDRGIVGALDGAKPREILKSREEIERMFMPDFGD
ncbi:MAG: DNA translocase FtsK 4TM domain-containing protein [Chthonomonadales bacterium]